MTPKQCHHCFKTFKKIINCLPLVFQMILDRLEESASKQSQWDQTGLSTDRDVVESMRSEEEEAAAEAAADGRAPPSGLDEAEIRKFFSAGNLKNLRKDLSSKTSSCFGRRMDRIGSLSPLGCNSLGKYGEWEFPQTEYWVLLLMVMLQRAYILFSAFRYKVEDGLWSEPLNCNAFRKMIIYCIFI